MCACVGEGGLFPDAQPSHNLEQWGNFLTHSPQESYEYDIHNGHRLETTVGTD